MCAVVRHKHATSVRLLLVLVLLFKGATCTANVCSEQDFRAALVDKNVAVVLLTCNILLTHSYWAAYLPISIDRNITVRGPTVSFEEISTTLDLGYVKGKITLRASVNFMIELLVVSGAQAQANNNLDILTYSPNAKVTLSNVVYRRDACLVSQLAVPILLSTPRPKDCLGTQQAGSISWCDPSSKLCWYNITHQYNFCSFASNTLSPEIDDTGGYEVVSLNVAVACTEYITLACMASHGKAKCLANATANVMAAKASSASDSKSAEWPRLQILIPSVIGSIMLLGVAAYIATNKNPRGVFRAWQAARPEASHGQASTVESWVMVRADNMKIFHIQMMQLHRGTRLRPRWLLLRPWGTNAEALEPQAASREKMASYLQSFNAMKKGSFIILSDGYPSGDIILHPQLYMMGFEAIIVVILVYLKGFGAAARASHLLSWDSLCSWGRELVALYFKVVPESWYRQAESVARTRGKVPSLGAPFAAFTESAAAPLPQEQANETCEVGAACHAPFTELSQTQQTSVTGLLPPHQHSLQQQMAKIKEEMHNDEAESRKRQDIYTMRYQHVQQLLEQEEQQQQQPPPRQNFSHNTSSMWSNLNGSSSTNRPSPHSLASFEIASMACGGGSPGSEAQDVHGHSEEASWHMVGSSTSASVTDGMPRFNPLPFDVQEAALTTLAQIQTSDRQLGMEGASARLSLGSRMLTTSGGSEGSRGSFYTSHHTHHLQPAISLGLGPNPALHPLTHQNSCPFPPRANPYTPVPPCSLSNVKHNTQLSFHGMLKSSTALLSHVMASSNSHAADVTQHIMGLEHESMTGHNSGSLGDRSQHVSSTHSQGYTDGSSTPTSCPQAASSLYVSDLSPRPETAMLHGSPRSRSNLITPSDRVSQSWSCPASPRASTNTLAATAARLARRSTAAHLCGDTTSK